jgi:hypothetical protein
MTEQWVQWKPLEGLEKRYSIECISDDKNGFRITLSGSDQNTKKVIITFKNSVYAYRNTEEGLRIQIINELDKKYGDKFYVEWTFFKVINSSYLQWLSGESDTVADYLCLQHFSLLTADSIVDVLNHAEPTVTFLDEET